MESKINDVITLMAVIIMTLAVVHISHEFVCV